MCVTPYLAEAVRARHVVCVTLDEMAAQNIVFSSLPDDAALRQVAVSAYPDAASRCNAGRDEYRLAYRLR